MRKLFRKSDLLWNDLGFVLFAETSRGTFSPSGSCLPSWSTMMVSTWTIFVRTGTHMTPRIREISWTFTSPKCSRTKVLIPTVLFPVSALTTIAKQWEKLLFISVGAPAKLWERSYCSVVKAPSRQTLTLQDLFLPSNLTQNCCLDSQVLSRKRSSVYFLPCDLKYWRIPILLSKETTKENLTHVPILILATIEDSLGGK